MNNISQEEIDTVSQILDEILANDNDTRKAAEAKLS